MTHWYFTRDQYDPSRPAACKTFMSRVIENKLMDIIKERESQKRKGYYQSVSLEELTANFDGDDYSEDLAVEDENLASAIKSDVSEILLRAYKKLSRRQREICRLIQIEGLNLKQTSERLKIPRTTLYDDIFRIRDVFREEGLRDYL